MCQLIAYRSCPDSLPGCGIKNNTTCTSGKVSNSKCARNACNPIISNGRWQPICEGVHAIEISGPCSAILAKGFNGSKPFGNIFQRGFHGLRSLGENGTQYTDNVKSVKLVCTGMLCLF